MLVTAIHYRDWSIAIATIGAFIATAVLAYATWRLASRSADEIRETRKQAQLAADQFALQLEPRIIPEPSSPPQMGIGYSPDYKVDRKLLPFEIAIRNVGHGVATIERVDVRWRSLTPEVVYRSLLPADDVGGIRADFVYSPDMAERPGGTILRAGDEFTVEIGYRSFDGRRYLIKFAWVLKSGDRWAVWVTDDQGDHIKR